MKKLRLFKPLFIIVLINLCFVFNINGQRLNYDDIYQEFDEMTNRQAYLRLMSYQSQDPYFANTYIQLGHFSEKILKNLDPLRNIHLVENWANDAVLYYQLFPSFLESREVRRNSEYYTNIPIKTSGERLGNEDALNYIQERIEFCENYKDSVFLIYSTLEKSKDHYNNCVRIFKSINNDYDNLNEVYLQADDEFLSLLEELKQEFNLAILEFENYKSLIQDFPIGDYDQSYKLRDIQTFRLDGLTNSDFLQNTFFLWDYEKWVNQFKNTYNEDILALREEIVQIQNLFERNTEKLLELEFAEPETQLQTYDELFLYRLGRYDSNSLIRELFRYLDERQDYLLMSRNVLSNPADTSSVIMGRKVRYYYRLAMQLDECKDLLEEFNNSINTRRVRRFSEFFNQYYQGEEGLKDFYQEQKTFNNNFFNNNLQDFKNYLENVEQTRSSHKYATLEGGNSIPLYTVSENDKNYENLTYITREIFYDQDIPGYAAGYIKRQESESTAFIAKISEDLKVEWLEEIEPNYDDVLNEGNQTEIISAFENGVMAILRSKLPVNEEKNNNKSDKDKIYKNTLVKLDTLGNIVYRQNINETFSPVYLDYDEINQISIMGFGKKDEDNPDVYSAINICKADTAGNLTWTAKMDIKGQLVDIVRAENKYIAYLNFQNYDIKGDRIITGDNGKNWAFLIADVSFDGEILKTTPVITKESFFLNNVFSISSDEINLIGKNGHPYNPGNKLKYFIVSSDSEMIFDNIE